MPHIRPWLDRRRPAEERVEALLAEMTLEELVGQLHQSANLDADATDDRDLLRAGGVGSTLLASGATAGNVRDAGVTRARVDALQHAAAESRLGIPLLIARDVIHGHRTVFPIPLGLAATFDAELVERIGSRSAAEATADGITWAFSPMLDVVDDARWGRVAESFGESAPLGARLGSALVRGLQSSGALAATAKHFVGYGLSRGGRDYARVDVGELMLRNVHLRPFQAAVDAGVRTVMAAFSDVDGIPMHSHRHLLRGVLKGEWGFSGVVVADWDGIGELVRHGVAVDLRDAARQAIEAGVDVDMVSGAYAAHLAELVADGTVDRTLVEDAARRVLRLKMSVGLFDEGCPTLPGHDTSAASGTPKIDRDLALEAASASLVTLVDDGRPAVAVAGRVLLTGAYAHERASMLGTWVLDGDPRDVPTIAEALSAAFGGRAGSPELLVDDGAFPDRTLRLARESETVVALVGEHAIRSGEDSAVSALGLPPGQIEVLRALRSVSRRLVVVVLTGRPLILADVAAVADRVIVAWHPGTEGGRAIARALLDDAPSTGLVPMAFPHSVGQVPLSHTERPSGRPQPDDPRGLGRYQDAAAAPFAAFGSGATRLRYGPLRGPSNVALGDTVELAVDVTNVGDGHVREAVLLYARADVAEITRPLRELLDVAHVEVAPQSVATVRFTVPTTAFGYHGRDTRFRVDRGRVHLVCGWGRPDESVHALEVVDHS